MKCHLGHRGHVPCHTVCSYEIIECRHSPKGRRSRHKANFSNHHIIKNHRIDMTWIYVLRFTMFAAHTKDL